MANRISSDTSEFVRSKLALVLSIFSGVAAPQRNIPAEVLTTSKFDREKSEREAFWEAIVVDAGGAAEFIDAYRDELLELVRNFVQGTGREVQAGAEQFASETLALVAKREHAKLLSRMLAAMTAALARDAAQPKAKKANVRFGFRLCDFLVAIGGAKLAQALHHFDDTPTEWRIGLCSSKDNVEPVSQSEFEQFARSVLPEHMLLAIEAGDLEIEELVGTGTYLQTHRLKLSPKYRGEHREYRDCTADDTFVLQLVKPDAAERAKDVYEFMLELIGSMGKTRRIGTMATVGLEPIISHHLEMLEEETDFVRSRDKARLAARMAQAVTMVLQNNTALLFGRKFSVHVQFAAAGIYEFGAPYRVSKEMKGVLFHTMPTDTAEQSMEKYFVALASYLRNFLYLFWGWYFDYDAHGANQRVQLRWNQERSELTILIGMYDELGICSPPTDNQKRMFANMLLDGIACALLYGSNPDMAMAEAYYSVCRRMNRRTEKVHALLKGVVTTTDFQLYIDGYMKDPVSNAKAFIAIIKAFCSCGAIDPVIAEVFVARYESLQLLMHPRSARSERERGLLAEEQRRQNDEYPLPKPDGMSVAGAQAVMVQSVFRALKGRLGLGRPGPYRMIVTHPKA